MDRFAVSDTHFRCVHGSQQVYRSDSYFLLTQFDSGYDHRAVGLVIDQPLRIAAKSQQRAIRQLRDEDMNTARSGVGVNAVDAGPMRFDELCDHVRIGDVEHGSMQRVACVRRCLVGADGLHPALQHPTHPCL